MNFTYTTTVYGHRSKVQATLEWLLHSIDRFAVTAMEICPTDEDGYVGAGRRMEEKRGTLHWANQCKFTVDFPSGEDAALFKLFWHDRDE